MLLYLICLYYFRVIVGWTAGKPPLAAATCIHFATRFPSGLREEVIMAVTHPHTHEDTRFDIYSAVGWGLLLSGIAVVFALYVFFGGIDVTRLGDFIFAA